MQAYSLKWNLVRSFLLLLTTVGLFAQAGTTPTARYATVADMVADKIPNVPVGVSGKMTALVTGRVTANDGGGGMFFFVPGSTTATNLGTVFPCNGTGRWFREYESELNSKWFGAVGDGVTDDTDELRDLHVTAFANSDSIAFYAGDNYLITGSITNRGVNTRNLGATITASGDIVAYIVGNGSGAAGVMTKLNIQLPAITKATRNWTGPDTGLVVHNLYGSKLSSPYIQGFSTGFRPGGLGSGCVHNIFEIGELLNNKTNLFLTADGTGWVNENKFVKGEFTHSSTLGTNVTGVVHVYIDDPGFDPNNNVFDSCSFEGTTAEYIAYIKGQQNWFQWCRYESNPKVIVMDGSAAQDNVFFYGYELNGITFSEINSANATKIYGNDWVKLRTVNSGLVPNLFLQNKTGNAAPVLNTYLATENIITNNTITNYTFSLTSEASKWKTSTDTLDRLSITSATGNLLWGSGSGAGDVNLYRGSSTRLQTDDYFRSIGIGVNENPTSQYIGWFRSDQNSPTTVIVYNINTGASAYAELQMQADTGVLSLRTRSSAGGNTGSIIASSGLTKLNINADNSGQTVDFSVGGVGNVVDVSSSGLDVVRAGSGIRIKEGSNARMGTTTLIGGTITVANTSVTASTRIFITPTETGTMNGRLRVSARVAATSFTISSSDAGDTCTVDWLLIEPAP